MAYDPSIILSGQPVNILGAMSAGNALAAETMGMQRQNALNQLYATQGPGIMNGDPQALNALAGFDPMAAMGIKSTHQAMQFDAEKMRMAAAEHAAKLDADTLAKQAADLERDMQGAAYYHATGDRAGYDAFLRQNGMDPAQYSFENFPALAAQSQAVLEVWKGFKPVPPSGDNFRVVGTQVVDLTAEGGPKPVFQAENLESGTVVYDPATGNPVVSTGTAKPVKPFTEAQSKDVVFATRAQGALDVLDPVANALASVWERAVENDPTGLLRGFQSDEFQIASQAGLEFLQAILRKDTGAAITPQETASYGRTYLPEPGDNEAVLVAKKAARARAVEALKAGMSPAQILAQEKALKSTAQPVQRPAQSPAQGSVPPEYQYLLDKYGGPLNRLRS